MTLHNNPEPLHPDTHTTRVTSNDRFVSAGISLGDLIMVRKYSAWHNQQPLYELRFRHGAIDISHGTLTAIVRHGQEALCAPDRDADCSGAVANLDETA
jgi:hypothetical protein